ncbi:MAG: hypothetical protein ACKOTD_11040, partial [Phycisphaerales bacterium]
MKPTTSRAPAAPSRKKSLMQSRRPDFCRGNEKRSSSRATERAKGLFDSNRYTEYLYAHGF